MPASTEFPPGWEVESLSSPGPSIVTIAGVAGVTHVLDSIFARITNSGTGAAFVPELEVITSAFTKILCVLSCPATVVVSDEVTFSGLGIVAPPGSLLTVQFNAGSAGYFESIVIQGHDV